MCLRYFVRKIITKDVVFFSNTVYHCIFNELVKDKNKKYRSKICEKVRVNILML